MRGASGSPRLLFTPFSSCGRKCGVGTAHEEGKAGDVVGPIFQADCGPRPGKADGADVAALHGCFHGADNVLDPNAHVGAFGVGGFLFGRAGLVALGAFVNMGRASLVF